jgi:predicted tellurium resistance membrane protein TerC
VDAFLTADGLIALLTLSVLEIVLGVDNVVFIAILTARLPTGQQALARRLGLGLALLIRIGLLFAITWIMQLTRPLFAVLGHEVSGRDLILLGGGLFLIFKATWEIYDKLEVEHTETARGRGRAEFAGVIVQILLLDVVFSLDSVITAVGMAQEIAIMVGVVSGFVERHPSVKILALAFLLLIGVLLVAEGFGRHVPKGYIYFAMAFSLLVELLNLRYRKQHKAVSLHHRFEGQPR